MMLIMLTIEMTKLKLICANDDNSASETMERMKVKATLIVMATMVFVVWNGNRDGCR